jgi:hypothetical protein
MNGMTGGRPSTHRLTASEATVAMIRDQVPAAMLPVMPLKKHRQGADLPDDIHGLLGIERKVPPPPVHRFDCHVLVPRRLLEEIRPLPFGFL